MKMEYDVNTALTRLAPTRPLNDAELLGLALDRICEKWEIEIERPQEIVLPEAPDLFVMGHAGENLIRMRKDLGNLSPEHLSTWVHEVAHEVLHYQKGGKQVPSGPSDPYWAYDEAIGNQDQGNTGTWAAYPPLGASSGDKFGPSWIPDWSVGRGLGCVYNRIGYPVSRTRFWECEAESVTKFFFQRIGMPCPKLSPYMAVEHEWALTDAQRVLLRILGCQFAKAKSEGREAPDYAWNVVPAHPRYSVELYALRLTFPSQNEAFVSYDKWITENVEKTMQSVANNEDILAYPNRAPKR